MRVSVKIASIALILISLNFKGAYSQEAKRRLLKNGLVVLVEESHKAPLVAIEARIKTGSATEQGYLGSGISHFVEHMLFKGTKKWPSPGDIERQIKSIGGYINGFTSHDSTGVIIIVPSSYLNNALEIIRDVLVESLFDPDELEKEREVILKEIRLDNDEPSKYLSLLVWSNMFKTHNYRFPVIGCEELLKKLKREDLITYYRARYIPDNIVLGVVGDVNTEAAFKSIEGLFGDIDKVSPPQGYSQPEPPQIAGLEIEEERDVALTYLSIGFHSVGVRDKDMFNLDVLSILLGSGEDSRLFKALYKQKKLVYSIGSFNYTPREPGIFAINAALKSENVKPAMDEIWNQVESLKLTLVSEKELEKAKNSVLSSYIFSRQTVQDKVNDLVGGEVIAGDYDFSRKYVDGVKAVTRESVREAAQRYLRRENSTVVRLLPRQIGKLQEKEEKRTVRIGLLSNVERFELKNKMRVFLLEDHSLPIISLNVVGLAGLRTENFKNNGISNLVSDTLLCGTRKRTEEELFSQIEGVGAALNSFSGSNTFGVSANSLSKDLDLALEIFSDVLENPGFPIDKVEREKSVTRGEIKVIDENIYQSGVRTLKYNLFKEHPYRFQSVGRVSTITGLSQKEIANYYRTYYSPSNMVLTLSGDIDKKTAKEKIIRLFERFEKRPPAKISPPKERKRPMPRMLIRRAEKGQSLVMLGYLGTTIYSHDKYVLGVLSSILSGVNGRLSRNIREQKALAYTLDAISLPGIEPGMIIFYIGTTKENLKTATEELFKEIEGLKKDGVDDEELKSAKSELVGLHQMSLQKIQDVTSRISVDELYGLGYDNLLRFEDRIKHITKECVVRAARKYLSSDSYVLVTIKGGNSDKDKEG